MYWVQKLLEKRPVRAGAFPLQVWYHKGRSEFRASIALHEYDLDKHRNKIIRGQGKTVLEALSSLVT